MATKTLYFKDAVPSGATLHRSLQDGGVAPTTATTTTGWNAGTNVLGQSCLQNGGTEVARTAGTWGTTLQPSAAPSQTVGDCWRSENTISGTFANTNWVFSWLMRSVTAAYTGRFKLAVRIWRSTNANGTGAVEVTSGRVVSAATSANMSTSADTSITCTWTPGATVTLASEYLFVNVGIEITTAGSGTTTDMDFRVGSTATVVTPDFSATQALTPGLASNSGSFFAPTVAAGAVALTPGLFSSGSTTFHAATVGRGAVALTASLAANSSSFHAATVDLGAAPQPLTPSLFASSASFYAPTVSPGSVSLTATRVDAVSTFHAATVAPGAVGLAAARFDGSETFQAPTVTPGPVGLTPSLFAGSQTFYAGTVGAGGETQALVAQLAANSASFHEPSVSSTYTLAAELMESAQAFYTPIVEGFAPEPSDVDLSAALVIGVSVFYGLTVTSVEPIHGAASGSGGRTRSAQSGGRSNVQSGDRSSAQTAKR